MGTAITWFLQIKISKSQRNKIQSKIIKQISNVKYQRKESSKPNVKEVKAIMKKTIKDENDDERQ